MIRRSFQEAVPPEGLDAPAVGEIRAYVLEMMLELAGLALVVGDGDLAGELNALLARHTGQRRPSVLSHAADH